MTGAGHKVQSKACNEKQKVKEETRYKEDLIWDSKTDTNKKTVGTKQLTKQQKGWKRSMTEKKETDKQRTEI